MDEKRHDEAEETYTKVDKRVTKGAAEEPEAAEAPEPEPEPTPEPPEADQGGGEQTLADIGVFGILRFSASLLIQQAWIALGILAPPGGETTQNLAEAKIAIDTLAVIIEKLGPDLDVAERREMQEVLANLRVNFVGRAG